LRAFKTEPEMNLANARGRDRSGPEAS